MTVSVVLAVVLGLALLGAVMALIRVERDSSASRPRRPPAPGVTGHAALVDVDLGLRTLSAVCAHAGRDLPDLYAVVCSEERIALRLAKPDTDAARPWEADETGEQWSVTRKLLADCGNGAPADTHPFPLTVTVGLHEGDRVLVDLARSSGPVALTGEAGDVRRLARSLVAEVVTGPVGRGAEVVLVGSAADLAGNIAARSARLHIVAAMDDVPEARAERAERAESSDAGSASANPSVTQVFRLIEGRKQPIGGRLASRLFVVDAAQLRQDGASPLPDGGQADILLVLGDTVQAGWRFEVGADGSLRTGALGLTVDTHAARLT
jgi:hypothetical protein